jgi:AcrR family transcriptional regulator
MDVRESLLKATVKVFSEAGARGATTRRIALEAGVNEVTLFRHFKSKDDLLETALTELAQLVADRRLPDVPVNPVAELSDWARDHHKQLHKYRALIRKTLGEFEEHPSLCACTCAATTRITSDLADYLKTLQIKGLASKGFTPHAAAAMLMGSLFTDAVGRDAMPDRFPYPMKDAVDLMLPLFFNAIGLSTSPTKKTAK